MFDYKALYEIMKFNFKFQLTSLRSRNLRHQFVEIFLWEYTLTVLAKPAIVCIEAADKSFKGVQLFQGTHSDTCITDKCNLSSAFISSYVPDIFQI